MARYRKKRIVIDAVQFTGSNRKEIVSFIEGPGFAFRIPAESEMYELQIFTLEGTMTARPGDWVIRGVKGEYYPCKPDIFEETYESVE